MYYPIFGQPIKGINIHKYFKFIEEVKIPNDIIVGEINGIDCFQNKFLIVDGISKEVILIEKKNGNIITLNPESCHPGFHWRPIYAFFDRTGIIYVINSIPCGFKFGNNGECIGPMDDRFSCSHSLAFNNKNEVIGYYTGDFGNYLNVMDENGIEKYRFGEFPDKFENLIKRFRYGGIVIDRYDNLYQVNVSSPSVIKYNSSCEKVGEFVNYPSYFRSVIKDLPTDIRKSIKVIQKIAGGKTLTQNIFLIDKNKIAVQLSHIQKFSYGLEIYDLEGNYLLKDEITYNKPILAAKDGFIYFSHQPEADTEGNIDNPSVLIYKLIMD
jgi:hypothetical protein